jgi:hypothetical protein
LIINQKLLDDVEYYKISNFNSYVKQTNHFVNGIYNNYKNYISTYIMNSKIFLLFNNNWVINMISDLLKIFNLNPTNYIIILYKKFIFPLLLIPFFLSRYILYRKIENLLLNFLTVIFFIYYTKYIFNINLLCIFI